MSSLSVYLSDDLVWEMNREDGRKIPDYLVLNLSNRYLSFPLRVYHSMIILRLFVLTENPQPR